MKQKIAEVNSNSQFNSPLLAAWLIAGASIGYFKYGLAGFIFGILVGGFIGLVGATLNPKS